MTFTLQSIRTQIRTDTTLGLIWIQTVCIPEIVFLEKSVVVFFKSAEDQRECKNYPPCIKRLTLSLLAATSESADTLANSLDSDQFRQKDSPDLDPTI